VEKYTYKWLRKEDVGGRAVHVLERYPVDKNSGYTRQIAWVDEIMYQPIKVEFYDRKDSLLKTLTFHDYKQYLDHFWRPDRMEMVNHQTGKSTTLSWSGYEFKAGLSDADFDKNALKRAR
jgi:outer membrane lipoprotein-sorting protein